MSIPTKDKPYTVDFTQHGSGVTLATFATEQEARAWGYCQWRINHDDYDFKRAEWSVSLCRFNDEGELIDGETLWSAKADGPRPQPEPCHCNREAQQG